MDRMLSAPEKDSLAALYMAGLIDCIKSDWSRMIYFGRATMSAGDCDLSSSLVAGREIQVISEILDSPMLYRIAELTGIPECTLDMRIREYLRRKDTSGHDALVVDHQGEHIMDQGDQS